MNEELARTFKAKQEANREKFKKIMGSLLVDKQNKLPGFEILLQAKGISPDDPRVQLLKEFWNQAIGLGSDTMMREKGTDKGFKRHLVL